MPGLAPGIHRAETSTDNLVVYVVPLRNARHNQIYLPLTRLVLDILLALDCAQCGVVTFVIDERLHLVFLGEAVDQSLAMLMDAANEIVGDADIECSVRTAGEDVDPKVHSKMMDCRVKPGNDECGCRSGVL